MIDELLRWLDVEPVEAPVPQRPSTLQPKDQRALVLESGILRVVHPDGSTSVRAPIYGPVLVRLMQHPGEDLDCRHLGADAVAVEESQQTQIDALSKEQTQGLIRQLEAKIAEATASQDLKRRQAVEALEQQREKLAEHLRKATRPGGKAARFAGERERARQRVTKGIKHLLNAIRREAPKAAEELDKSIKKGEACRYTPLPGIEWQISP